MRMRIVFAAAFLLCSFGASILSDGHAAERTKLWSKMCASCHDGTTAIDEEGLRDRYPTVDDFTAAVLKKGNPCMNILKNDKKLIRKIANEIGIPATADKK